MSRVSTKSSSKMWMGLGQGCNFIVAISAKKLMNSNTQIPWISHWTGPHIQPWISI